MRKSARSKELFWKFRDGEITRKELNRELDKLADKQMQFKLKRR